MCGASPLALSPWPAAAVLPAPSDSRHCLCRAQRGGGAGFPISGASCRALPPALSISSCKLLSNSSRVASLFQEET